MSSPVIACCSFVDSCGVFGWRVRELPLVLRELEL